MYKVLAAAAALAVEFSAASPLGSLDTRQSCPCIHIFGARETTASPGYGTAGVVVNLILNAYPGSTAEAISYPACGGQSSCGGASYASSASQGTSAVASVVNAYAAKCPNTQIVLVGYSQGAQITDNAFCGGGDSSQGISSNSGNTINSQASAQVKAVIEMGNPRYIYGLSYEVGTCRAQGFSPRPSGFSCPAGNGKIQSYCDSADPYCCNGNDANTHQGYGSEYGQAALNFVKSKLSASCGGSGATTTTATTRPSTTTQASTTTTAASGGGGGVAQYGQCGGQGYSGGTTCASPYTCKYYSQYYSQCL